MVSLTELQMQKLLKKKLKFGDCSPELKILIMIAKKVGVDFN